MKKLIALTTAALITTGAVAQQTYQQFNDIGQPTGTATIFRDGTTQYYGGTGQPTGTAKTFDSGTTQFYNGIGQPTGTVSSPYNSSANPPNPYQARPLR